MTNNLELLNYMPDYYNGVYEMKELLKVQGVAFSEIDEQQKRLLLNQFVAQADSNGLSVFENQLNITPDPDEDLEARRRKILIMLMPPQPITKTYFQNLLTTMGLEVNVTVDYGKNKVIIQANSGSIGQDQIDNVIYICNVYLPANMIFEINISLTQVQEHNNMYVGIGNTSITTATSMADMSQIND